VIVRATGHGIIEDIMKDPNIFSWDAYRRLADCPVNRRATGVALNQWLDGHDDLDYGSSEIRAFHVAFEAGWDSAQAFMATETVLPPKREAHWIWGRATCGQGEAPTCSKCHTAIAPSDSKAHEAECWGQEGSADE
jgi:hypothetical protein